MKKLVIHTKDGQVLEYKDVYSIYYDFTCNKIKFSFERMFKSCSACITDVISFRVY